MRLTSARQVEADRRKYDEDDRKRCTCVEHVSAMRGFGSIDNEGRCLNATRHPSGLCGDCRYSNVVDDDGTSGGPTWLISH